MASFKQPLVSKVADLGPLIPHHLSEFFAGIALMVIIAIVMWKFVVPKFEAAYAKRADQIRGGIERAEHLQAEAQKALTAYNNQLSSAQEDAARIREEAKAQGAALIVESRETAQQEAARISKNANAQINGERAKVMSELRTEIGGLATQLASKIVGESLTDDERSKRVVDRFIADFEEAEAGSPK